MTTPRTVYELLALYEAKGDEPYGESLTQTQHALQCAALARDEHAGDALVVAALFHDVGHLVADVQGEPGFDLSRDDDDHEARGAQVLAPLFGPAVAQPVALHVTAKRWRCAREPEYASRLSTASLATLAAQGGPLDDVACRRFEDHPGFEDALRLREWDDDAKIVGLEVGELRDYHDLITSLASTWSRGRLAH